MATMWLGVRPIMRLASSPTARGRPSLVLTATTDGSFRTMPRPRTYTRVLAVPRSTAISLPSREEKKLSDMRKCPRPREVFEEDYCPRGEWDNPTPWSPHPQPGKEQVEFPFGRFGRVRAVNQVLGQLDGQVSSDGSGRRLAGIGDPHDPAHDGVGVLRALDHQQDRGRAGDERHQVAVEGLAFVLGVVAALRLLVDAAQLHGDDAQLLAFQAGDDLAHQTALDSVGLADDKGAVHAGPHPSDGYFLA